MSRAIAFRIRTSPRGRSRAVGRAANTCATSTVASMMGAARAVPALTVLFIISEVVPLQWSGMIAHAEGSTSGGAPASKSASAQSPQPGAWVKSLKAKGTLDTLLARVPRNVAVVIGNNKAGKPEFARIDKSQFDAQGLYELLRPIDLQWSMKIQEGLDMQGSAQADTRRISAQFERLTKVSDIGMLVYAPPGAQPRGRPWTAAFSAVEGDGKTKIGTFSAPPPSEGLNARGVLAWVADNLGYNAVVLDVQGAHVLVAGMKTHLRAGSQAVLFSGSAAAQRVAPSTAQAARILMCTQSDGAYAVFETHFAAPDAGKIEAGMLLYAVAP